MKNTLLLAAAIGTVLAGTAGAQLTHYTWNGSQAISWMGYAVDSIRQPDGGRRLLIGQPLYNKFVFPTTLNDTGIVRCYAGTDPGGPALFNVFGDEYDQLGRSIANVGDLNGDKYEDFAVGAPYGSVSPTLNQEGFVRVCSGKDGTTLFTLDSPKDYSMFGHAVGGPGDVNGDGTPDILVGAPDYDVATTGPQDQGRVYVYSGKNGSLLQAHSGNASSKLGYSVTGVGDVNGDGRADFAAGAQEDDTFGLQAGRVVVYLGGIASVWKSLYGDSTQDDYGRAIAGLGDCNADGKDDLIVGAPGEAGDRGLVAVYLGPTFDTLYKEFVSATVNDRMGSSVDFAGDVDKDGYDDIIMGASQINGVVIGPGKVYGRSGKTGATLIPAQTGVAFGDDFGSSIAGVGDANGDGWDDVLVGAPFGDALAEDAGGARLIGWQVVQPDVGGGGVGAAQLSVFGAALATGYTAQIQVTGGPSGAPAWLAVSALQLPLPFKGGTIVPNVNAALFLFFPLDVNGAAKTLALGGGGPFSAYVQCLVQDAAQAKGWQLTHCVRMDFLP